MTNVLHQRTVLSFHDIMLRYRRVKVKKTIKTVGMSTECVGHILHVELDTSKLSVRWLGTAFTESRLETTKSANSQREF